VLTGICLHICCVCHDITEWKRPAQVDGLLEGAVVVSGTTAVATVYYLGFVVVRLKRLLDESPCLQFTSECQRCCPPPRLNK
jgi:hypothetical protein